MKVAAAKQELTDVTREYTARLRSLNSLLTENKLLEDKLNARQRKMVGSPDANINTWCETIFIRMNGTVRACVCVCVRVVSSRAPSRLKKRTSIGCGCTSRTRQRKLNG